jgi:alpha-galactosidase
MMLCKTMVFVSSCAAVVFSLLSQSTQLPGNAQETYTSDVRFTVKRSPVDVAPDGDLSKPLWKNANFVEFDHDASGKSDHPELSTRVESLWTDSYIYFGFSGRYDSLYVYSGEDPATERWQLWDRDVVEVFLNPQPERVQHYYEFEVAPNNQWIDLEIDKTKDPFNDASWNSGFEHATRIDAKNRVWTTELRIPLSSINVKAIRSGFKWRANFFRASGEGPDDRRKFLAWSIIPGGGTFHVPTRFGILEFVN